VTMWCAVEVLRTALPDITSRFQVQTLTELMVNTEKEGEGAATDGTPGARVVGAEATRKSARLRRPTPVADDR
jgi:hypothetical protein